MPTNKDGIKINLNKGKKLQEALVDWYKIKYKALVLKGKIFYDGIVLKKSPTIDDGNYIIIEIRLKKSLFSAKLDQICVYEVSLKKPLKDGEKIILHLPQDLKLQFTPEDVFSLDKLDNIICEYFNKDLMILKKLRPIRSIRDFLDKRKLIKK